MSEHVKSTMSSKLKPRRAVSPAKKEDLLSAVRRVAQQFEKLSEEYAEAAEGYRVQIYNGAEDCYKIGLGFMNNLDEYARFKADPFWADIRQKPKDDKIMKAVLTFAMKAKSRQLLNRVSKTAAVLESLAQQQVDASEVAQRLQAGGGIEAMYRALSTNRKMTPCLLDDHEILNPALAEDDEEENPGDDEETSEEMLWDSDNPLNVDEGWDQDADHADGVHKSLATKRAASAGGEVTGFGSTTKIPRLSRSRNQFDPECELVIDLSLTNVSLEQALSMSTLSITAEVGPPDEQGWRPVRAVAVRTAARISGRRSKPDGDGEID